MTPISPKHSSVISDYRAQLIQRALAAGRAEQPVVLPAGSAVLVRAPLDVLQKTAGEELARLDETLTGLPSESQQAIQEHSAQKQQNWQSAHPSQAQHLYSQEPSQLRLEDQQQLRQLDRSFKASGCLSYSKSEQAQKDGLSSAQSRTLQGASTNYLEAKLVQAYLLERAAQMS